MCLLKGILHWQQSCMSDKDFSKSSVALEDDAQIWIDIYYINVPSKSLTKPDF